MGDRVTLYYTLTDDETIFLFCAILQTLCLCYLVLRHP
jgi:hypothetical protein